MDKTLFDAKGNAVRLRRELGRGGEGAVFEVEGRPELVAKVYHSSLSAIRQSKLAYMASSVDQSILNYAAWPQETLHAKPNGAINGFLMAKVVNREPIHKLYSPAHRKQDFPKAAWDFLLYVARNTAAAFSTLHAQGHVIGDVNQGNVVVGADSKVTLIDCDSFQIRASNTLHLCEVGVPHFTPPELQGTSSFASTQRTENHDNFGLALLIFHLLFGGRHPFSGVPLRNDVGNQLEADIKAFRFAYSRTARARGFDAPPNALTLALVPDSIGNLFERAFTESGAAPGGRPSAAEWVNSLDSLRTSTKKCAASAMHLFPATLSTCPWCSFESKGVVYFIDVRAYQQPGATGFQLAQVWAAIEAVAPPGAVAPPAWNHLKPTPQQLPSEYQSQRNKAYFARTVILGLGIWFTASQPALFFVALIVGWLAWSAFGKVNVAPERVRREQQRSAAQQQWDMLCERWNSEVGTAGFTKKKSELIRLKTEYQALDAKEQRAMEELKSTAEERQKQRYLERFFISDASISGVGPGRTTVLASHGIETAADISASRIKNIKGFGEGLTRALVDWRKTCECGFRFNPSTAVSASDIAGVRNKIAALRIQFEKSLAAGPSELSRFKSEQQHRAAALQKQFDVAAAALAQAHADLKVC
ncbi:helix-hairpin-helix domain-containing protein [Ralstonia solanacearum]|uniref:helix-hairpin-helix domain-containing protein n=1 Tax=Ralstonia solanacearum TaxID=305 RepID=UPI00202A9B2B|nr:helix-hairpin-helix domain-containing protein [Ralstonia solanacearum]MCL9845885.1 helix-hairpin-helix domain-containing protein [Ralstonia solanacearum]MDC6254467.1 helix-hairpin-helix domain-containing protein [Ralstonia solanacearum]MDC6258315.1 helix-hairpin-helix domain-containing protein [Ralstonia solanacearum]MDC6302963.1 helix-hairpin-helix domain-containing protein [Ralstonia solanacearum]